MRDTLRSELSTYAEPTSGPLAQIRLIGSRNVKLYPNSACMSYRIEGSGYPAGPQMGGQRKRDIGMPKVLPMPKHYVEINARANQRITAGFAYHTERITGLSATGVPNTKSTDCVTSVSFVPKIGGNYEVGAGFDGQSCGVGVYELIADPDGQLRRVPYPSEPADACSNEAT